jgi:AcrR family transcriptional regulator
MQTETLLLNESFERRVLERVAAVGPHGVGFNEIAEVLGCSPSSLYRHFRGWHALMAYVHAEVVETIDARFDRPSSTCRAEFEQWWATMSRFLRTREGIAFLALRACAANGRDMNAVEELEVDKLRTLSRWIGKSPLRPGFSKRMVARTVWSLLLAASSEGPDGDGQERLRELAGSLVGYAEEETLH